MSLQVLELNQEQQAAVESLDGPYMLDAAPGSGKTTIITERAIALVEAGVNLDEILAVTFTVKAAQEMAQRIYKRTGVRPLWATNFHRLCTRLMRMFPEFGVPVGFSIANEDIARDLVKDVMRTVAPDADVRKFSPQVRDQVARNRACTLFSGLDPVTYWASKSPWILDAAAEYESRLARECQIDFDLILYKVALALRKDKDLRACVASLWSYVMVDEFQDTDAVQLDILKHIAPHRNVMAVGDIDQGLYRFRGAEPKNMRYFVDHFRAKVLPLQMNYRSRPVILDVANRVISNNADRYQKALIPTKEYGGQVTLRQYSDSQAEAEAIALEIQSLTQRGTKLKEIAVLYRVGSSSRHVEMALSKAGVPHRVVGSLRFWDRREVQDVMAWARVLAGWPDWGSWKRASENPRIGVGAAGWTKARQAGTPEEGLATFHASKAGKMLGAIRDARSKGEGADALAFLLDRSGYMESLREECGPNLEDLAQREASVNEVLLAVREFSSVTTFLDEVALGCPERDVSDKTGVVLSTIHSAKGLEWDHVFIVALADEVLPHYHALRGGEEDMAEERRLLYVAITRAREGVHMSFPAFLDQVGAASKVVFPSRFITEAGISNRIQNCMS